MRAVEALRRASSRLREGAVSRPRWTAEQLLSMHRRCAPIALYLENPALLAEEELLFKKDVAAAAQGMPLQYLLQAASFYGRDFEVGPGVFIPRPETEVLVDVTLKQISKRLRSTEAEKLVVLDVGTGCGAIAVTLALERPDLFVMGMDRSSNALSFAKGNALRHKADVAFFEGDLLRACGEKAFDLVVANLPYLDAAVSGEWPRELAWEPRISLDGGERGLSWTQKLMRQASTCVRPGGHLVMEIGDGQGETVCRKAQASTFQLEEIVADLSGKERVVVLRAPWKS